MTVDRSRESDTRDRADGRGLRRTAAFVRAAGVRWRRVPHLFTGVETQREHAAAFFRIRDGRLTVRYVDASEIRKCDIDVGSVGCRSPLHAAVDPALADACLPEDLPVAIGIHRMDHSRFLA